MCVQDPFVLDHNTAFNVNDKAKINILAELAGAKITYLKSRDSSDDGAVTKCRLTQFLSSKAMPLPVVASSSAAVKDILLVQSFSVTMDSSKLSTSDWLQAYGSIEEMRAVWCMKVGELIKGALIEIMGVTFRARSLTTWGILSSAKHGDDDGKVSTMAGDLKSNRTDALSIFGKVGDMVAPLLESMVRSSKRLSSEDEGCRTDANIKRRRSSMEDSHGDETSAMDDITRDMAASVTDTLSSVLVASSGVNESTPANSGEQEMSGGESMMSPDIITQPMQLSKENKPDLTDDRVLLYAGHCSAVTCLWMGRKKLRQQLCHVQNIYHLEAEISRLLRAAMMASSAKSGINSGEKKPIVDFKLSVFKEATKSARVTVIMTPTEEGSNKQLPCFVIFFSSLVSKLVNRCVNGC